MNNTIAYFEHYPHYMAGDLNTTAHIDQDIFILLMTIAQDPDKQVDEWLDYEFDDTDELVINKDGGYALHLALFGDGGCNTDRIKHSKKVLKALKRSGYWADQWEEGSHGFALPGFEKQCIAAIAKIEAQIQEDTFDF